MIDALQANHGKLFPYLTLVCGNQHWAITCSMIRWVPLMLFVMLHLHQNMCRIETNIKD